MNAQERDGVHVVAEVFSDWRARYGRAIPEAAEFLAALERRGYTVVDQGHEGCRVAVEHVADNHHGPDYPKCAAAWAPVASQADGELREEIARLAEQWDDMARDHEEQGFTTAAQIYRAHARHLRRALDNP